MFSVAFHAAAAASNLRSSSTPPVLVSAKSAQSIVKEGCKYHFDKASCQKDTNYEVVYRKKKKKKTFRRCTEITMSPTPFGHTSECEDLDEDSCASEPDCEGFYAKKGKGKKAKQVFKYCMESERETMSPTPLGHTGGCEVLDEDSCASDPDCEGFYVKKGKGKKAKQVFEYCVEYQDDEPISCWDLGEDDCAGHTEARPTLPFGKKKRNRSLHTVIMQLRHPQQSQLLQHLLQKS